MTRVLPLLAAAALLAAAPLLAGCIGTAQATAMETRGAADDEALRWDPAAKLAQVVGVEGSADLARLAAAFAASAGAGSGDFARASDDGEVGDGKAEVWLYRYLAPSKAKSLVVVVDRDGDVLRTGEEDRARSEPVLGEWRVDSDRALEIAKDANAGLRDGAGSERFGIVSVLARDPGAARPVWLVAGGGGDLRGGGGGYVKIDAVTGSVLESQGGFASAGQWARAWG